MVAKLGEPCPKVRLSQDRMPIELLTQLCVRNFYFREKFVAPIGASQRQEIEQKRTSLLRSKQIYGGSLEHEAVLI
jgi:hypothetical protein